MHMEIRIENERQLDKYDDKRVAENCNKDNI